MQRITAAKRRITKVTATKSPFNIILLGDPASGKATQAARLAKKYGMYDFDMGNELRHVTNPRDKARLQATINKGRLAPTDICRRITRDRLKNLPKSRPILFDGHPKMLGEAKLIYKLLEKEGRHRVKCLYLTIPFSEIVRRAKARVIKIRGRSQKRPDDTVDSIRTRAKYYRVNIKAVVKFFSSKYPYMKVSGLGTRDEVAKRLNKALEKMK